jgi:hypothetical protein
VRRVFSSWKRSTLAEIYLCPARSDHETEEVPGQVGEGAEAAEAVRAGTAAGVTAAAADQRRAAAAAAAARHAALAGGGAGTAAVGRVP